MLAGTTTAFIYQPISVPLASSTTLGVVGNIPVPLPGWKLTGAPPGVDSGQGDLDD